MAFDLEQWKREIKARLEGWKPRMQRAGVNSAYAALSAAALWPVVQAAQRGEWAALMALGSVLAGVGGNLVANQIQDWKDKSEAQVAQQLAGQAAADPQLRAALDELLEKLEVLQFAQQRLKQDERAWFAETLQAELAQLGSRLSIGQLTVDGAVVMGSVSVSGGDFVARDKHEYYINADQLPEDLLAAYYRALAAECSRLPLGLIDTRFVESRGEAGLALPDIYIDLDIVRPPDPREAEDGRAWTLRLEHADDQERRPRQPLLEALLDERNRRAVLLGEAGSGKSTFVSYLAYALASGAVELPAALKGRLVLRLILREVAAHCLAASQSGNPEAIWKGVGRELAAQLGGEAAQKLLPYLQKRLLAEGGVVLLDGLDEVPEAERRRAALLEAVAKFSALLPKEKSILLVTARPYAYAEAQWRLPGFSTLALAAFDDKQAGRFVARFYQAVRKSMGWSEASAGQRGERLQSALGQRPYLADLASRPLLLTLMATLHASWGQLPEDRADLYEETVRLLLARWQQGRQTVDAHGQPFLEPGIQQTLGLGEERLRFALEGLAYAAHFRQGQAAGRDQAPADISEGDILLAFRPLLGEIHPDHLLKYLKERAGLLLARREGVYSFPHRSFQEYLAACCLANQPEFAERLGELVCKDPAWWREVCLLGVGKLRQGGLGQAVAAVNVLLPDDPPDAAQIAENQWRLAGLAGQALLELRLEQKAAGQAYYQALLKRARRWLVALLAAGGLNARERAEGGNTLAALGDPRFDPDRCFLPHGPRLGFVHIPAGKFLMGSDKKKDPQAEEREFPQHEVYLPDYYIARYPTTVAQFRAFVQESGYQPADADSLRGVDNHPVKWVTWYDARAYCAWLNDKLAALARASSAAGDAFWQGLASGKLVVSLPSEAEWEKAARGAAGRIYPWGDAYAPDRANLGDAGIGTTSPVGCFPAGAGPFDILDLSGNVWEWTRTCWGKGYPYNPADGREDLAASNSVPRVLRGGSFFNLAPWSRCAARRHSYPNHGSGDSGFRVGVFLPIS